MRFGHYKHDGFTLSKAGAGKQSHRSRDLRLFGVRINDVAATIRIRVVHFSLGVYIFLYHK